MIEHVDRIEISEDIDGRANGPVPIWLLNNRIDQINAAIDQISYHLETITNPEEAE